MLLLKSGFLERNEGGNYSNDNAHILTRVLLLPTWDEPSSRHGTQPHASTSQADSLNASPKRKFSFHSFSKMTDVVFYNATILVSMTRSVKLNPYRLALMQSRLSASIHLLPFRPSSLEMKIKKEMHSGISCCCFGGFCPLSSSLLRSLNFKETDGPGT